MFRKPFLVDIDTQTVTDLERRSRQLRSIATLAEANSARLILCATVPPPPLGTGDPEVYERILAVRRHKANEILQLLAESIAVDAVPELFVVTGKPFIAISQLVMAYDVGVVVSLAEQGTGALVDTRLMHLIRKCPSGVWLWRDTPVTDTRLQQRRIVVPIDRDIFAGSDASKAMATRLMRAALMGAGDAPAHITLLHSWSPYGLDVLNDSVIEPNTMDKYVDGQRYAQTLWLDERHDQLRALISKHPHNATITSDRQLLEGVPAEVIPDWLSSTDVDLLVLGTVGTGAVPGQLIGDTAETILLRSHMPVLTMKPADFESPVARRPTPRASLARASA